MQSSRLKLIYIITQGEWGGAQRYVFDLASALKDKFEVAVVTGASASHDLLRRCHDNGIKLYQLKNLVRAINPIKDFLAIKELANFIKQEKPNIIHFNSSKAGVIGALSIKYLQATNYKSRWQSHRGSSTVSGLQAKIIYTAHGWVFNEPLSRWRKELYILMEKTACKIHNKIIVLSKYDYGVAVKNRICAPKKMVIIPHGIQQINFLSREEALNILNAKFQIPNYKFLIGTIANLYATKGINYLVDAAKILSDKGVRPLFIIIGDGPERKNLELKIQNFKLKNFFLLGSLPNAATYLKFFDIFVLPSVKEGMPYAILEAAQAGLPIITTEVGAIPEILENEKSGLIVQPNNPEELASAIKKLLDDAELKDGLQRRVNETYFKKNDFKKMVEETSSMYIN